MPLNSLVRTVLSITPVLLPLAGCSTSKLYTEPGIQSAEAQILTKQYYWRRGVDPSHFTDAEIAGLFLRSPQIDPMDGERTELQGSQLIWALAAAGDRHFAELLSQQPADIRDTTLRHMESMWKYSNFHYPLTESLLNNSGM